MVLIIVDRLSALACKEMCKINLITQTDRYTTVQITYTLYTSEIKHCYLYNEGSVTMTTGLTEYQTLCA